ncbi:hypothetical protein V6N13_088697 [Hibiscus sabdariffa]
MVSEGGEWHWSTFEGLLPVAILLRITIVKCPLSHFSDDSMDWNATLSGHFSVRSTYRICDGIFAGPDEDIWKILTQFNGSQRMNFFYGWLCGDAIEDINHVLRLCLHAFIDWKQLIRLEKLQDFLSCDIKTWIKLNLTKSRLFAIDTTLGGINCSSCGECMVVAAPVAQTRQLSCPLVPSIDGVGET